MSTAHIIDTNVVAAGLLTHNDASPVARILDAMLAHRFPFVLSEALLAEYHRVLTSTKLRKLHGLSTQEIEAVLTDLTHGAVMATPRSTAVAAPDPGDQHLWDLLAARPDLVLVTGDKPLLQDAGMAGRVISAAAFCSSWTDSPQA